MKKHAFTLIELLIVVAIIAILAAIAVPNFLEAQTRSKVSRVKADMRSIATALEAYNVDTNHYPYPLLGADGSPAASMFPANPAAVKSYIEFVSELSTPVAYLTSVAIVDPFMPNAGSIKAYTNGWVIPPFYKSSCAYFSYDGFWGRNYGSGNAAYGVANPFPGYCLSSYGPDRGPDGAEHLAMEEVSPLYQPNMNRIYDPTNGTVSRGDIARFGGIPKFSNVGGGGN